jgi:hypothetical protein
MSRKQGESMPDNTSVKKCPICGNKLDDKNYCTYCKQDFTEFINQKPKVQQVIDYDDDYDI